MASKDMAVRARLARDGALFDGYHPEMEQVHREHAARLKEIMDDRGWPDRAMVGIDGAEAAWLILQHAIARPDVLRQGCGLLRVAAAEGRVAGPHLAMLEDRIRVFEGRLQVYGTQHDWDEDGELSPHPIEEPEGVDARRKTVGLSTIAEATQRLRERAASEGEAAPEDHAAHCERRDRWARRVGWRK